ncbi:hypothetical protein [Cumulibacter soli]|uniref:hypothetical protein n=1 Tax=Cumulibacter soli TaxID=2546344 RepID=UPI00106783FD|nr:hypothetical protein [Cumulibacter soli]
MTSDLAQIKTWWRALGSDGFFVLPPPTRSRYTQSDGHDDAVELLAERGLPPSTSFAYWHWQSHDSFERDGSLAHPLHLHWGGDYEVVQRGLGTGPDGYTLVDNGPKGAFALDRATARDGDGLPSPDDAAGVRQFLAELDEPIDRRSARFEYRQLTEAQETWLHDALAASGDLRQQGEYLTTLSLRDSDRPQEADLLYRGWHEQYADNPTEYPRWWPLLRSMLRHEHERAWELVAEIGPRTAGIVAQVPSERALDVLRDFALGGDAEAAGYWLSAYADLHNLTPIDAAVFVGGALEDQSGIGTDLWEELAQQIARLSHLEWTPAAHQKVLLTPLAILRTALDQRLPAQVRAAAARKYVVPAARMLDPVAESDPIDEVVPGYTAGEFRTDVARFAGATAELADTFGPALTGYEGALTSIWHEYRVLTPGKIAWLHAQVADPATEMQGLGFCLELLYAHGEATVADVDALRKRWKKVLAKKYETTYTEWRHPLVTLTCLAHDLGDPLAADLDTWWAKPTPKWKIRTRLLTLLGAPNEQKAAQLWAYVESGEHDEGHLLTWVLLRARLDGVRPLDIADSLIGSGIRDYVLHRVLFAAAVGDQPLWHYNVGAGSWHWWQRIVAVAEDSGVSAAARKIALAAARKHRVIAYPDDVRGVSTEDLAAAQRWLAERQYG